MIYLADIYLFKISNRNTSTRCEICSKLTIKTPERYHWRCSSVFMVNFEQVNAGWLPIIWVHDEMLISFVQM